MRFIDLLRIAAKNIKGRWAVLPIIGIAISMFCLCFAGATLKSVQEEKSLPHMLNIGAGSIDVTDNVIADIYEIPEVTHVTPILEIPASVKIDENTMEIILTGIESTYFTETFVQGGEYPESSVMPYIVMNESAGEQLAALQDDGGFGEQADAAQIDWISKNAAISTTGEGRWIVSKISGVLADNDMQEAAMYISIATAKELLQDSGQSTDYIGANVRITNIGHAQSVSKAICILGLSVSNSSEELQAAWDIKMNEITYLIIGGLFCLLCSSVLLVAWRKISLLEQRQAYTALRWMGMKEGIIGRLFVAQAAMISLFGIAIGILVSTSLPAFLSFELKETSIFTLPVTFGIVALCGGICFVSSILLMLNSRKEVLKVI